MNILFFSSVYPNPGDPTRGTFSSNLCTALADLHPLRVISPWPWHKRLATALRGGTGPTSARGPEGVSARFPWFFYPPGFARRRLDTLMWMSSRATIRQVTKDFAPECVLSYWAYPDGGAALRAARSIGVPLALIIGGSDILLIADHPARDRFLEVLREADLLLTVSHHLGEKLVEVGVDPSKIQVSYQGVDKARFSDGDRQEARARLGIEGQEHQLIWVGRMVPVKGLEVLLGGCATLRSRGRKFRLCLVGDGPLRRSLEEQTRVLGISHLVRFVGSKTPNELPDWYRSSDVFVLPSYSEGIPNVLREALSCGRPFIASRVGGIAELFHRSCRLVQPGDVTGLADAIEDVLDNPATPAELSSWILNPSWKDSARQVAEALMTCIGRNHQPAEVAPGPMHTIEKASVLQPRTA